MNEASDFRAQPHIILIVDDNLDNLNTAIALLDNRGFEIAVAQDGEDALERAELVQPALILLDIMMPGMDGLETCRRLKASEATRDIPVIFMTALSDTADKVAGFKAGGVDYVTKPLEIDEVVARVDTHLALRTMNRQLEAQNAQLQQEIATRERLQTSLMLAHDELEQRVAARTAELADANTNLKAEIAERKRAEEERNRLLASEQAARSKAEAADRLKDEFLATLSHELRTPLTAILGWSQLLLRTGRLDASTVRHGIEVIERNSKAELQIVEDLLDVSAIIHGGLVLNGEPVCLGQLIQSAFDSVRLTADAKSVCVSLSLAQATSKVWGDPGRLQQVVRNLLSNAVKFTPSGGRVEVSLQEVGPAARIRITDTGKGIKTEFLPHVFERFRQADSSRARGRGGLGLGLSIVKHLVELHGGSIRGESKGENQGATFTIDLPLMPVGEEALALPSADAKLNGGSASPTLTGLRILVVEDEPDVRELMTQILEGAGAEVRAATTAQEGFKVFESFRPNVIASDIGLPDEDGYALIQRIRVLPADQGGQTPAAALTAYAGHNARECTLAAGYQVHVPKPVEPTTLVKVIAMLADRE